MRSIFYNCSNLTTIFVSEKFVTTSSKEDNMFKGCSKLIGENGTQYSDNHVDYTYAHIDGGISNPGYFTKKKLTIENGYIKKIQPNTLYTDFVKNINFNESYTIKEGEKELTKTDIIKTGQILISGENTYTLVVLGDTNGDGKASIQDIMQINKYRLNKTNLEEKYLLAGDINEDGKTNIKDLLKINQYRLGIINIL